ncbi:cytochrome c oxidase subunit II [Sphingoaurantiacus capsulatus]|uniref:Cytochrome c oxidase subunit 2 n=1 Tax=Sphingoaurantiacus capsulatus TaxID=1771310 RepID=A0ABV7X6G1_9SPHN
MGRTKIWAVAAALAVLPTFAFAQTDQGTTAPSVAPAVSAERAATEAATTPLPTEPGAPAAPAIVDGQGSASAALDAAANPDGFPRAKPTPGIGQPHSGWEIQPQQTELGHYARWFNDVLLLPMMTAVTLIVLGLLGWTMFRFAAKRNPVASRTSHNTLIEVIWTVVPVLLLVIIAVPSFRLLADQYDPPKPDLTIKAIGHQWYWEYEYPDHGAFTFDAVMLSDKEAAEQGSPRLLDTDNRVIVPAGAVVKVLVTSVDVLHSWAMPAFWVKMDAVPGRINETWFKVDRPGVYFGQCSELCGTKHGFMPIAVEVVEPAQYNAWVAAKEAENGAEGPGPRFSRGADGKLVVTVAAKPAPAAEAAPAPAAAASPAAAATTPAAAPAAAPTPAE